MRDGTSQTRPFLGGWWLFVPLLAWAVARGFWAPDEPRYGQIAKECWDRGEWLVLHICGDVYPDKPPLVYWLSGLCGWATGWWEPAMRLPTLLATLGSALLLRRMASRMFGAAAAAWVVPLFLGTAMMLEIGGRLQLDPLMSVFILLAVDRFSCGARPAAGRVATSGIALGCAALAKGPVAWLHGGLALLALRLSHPAGRRGGFGPVAWSAVALLAVVPVAAWAVAASLAEPLLAEHLFFGQHLGRISTEAPHQGPPWEHLLEMPLLLLPTTPFVAMALARAWRTRRDDSDAARNLRFVALWLVATLVVFSAIPAKRALYMLPAYPAAALLAADELAWRSAQGAWRRWMVRAPAILLLVAAFAGLVVGVAASFPSLAESEPRLAEVAPLAGGLLVVAAMLAVFGWLAWRRSAEARGVDHLVQATGAGLLSAALFFAPALDEVKCARTLALEVAALPQKPAWIPVRGVQPEGYRFYGGAPTTRSRDLEGALEAHGAQFLALVEERDHAKLDPAFVARTVVLLRRQVGARDILVLGAKS
jgi:4-amino-4-deoxy-L-arabinose transferase-like glycosyltransferase